MLEFKLLSAIINLDLVQDRAMPETRSGASASDFAVSTGAGVRGNNG